MKKLVLCLSLIVILSACRKETTIINGVATSYQSTQPSSIEITSPDTSVYHPNGLITITWNNHNVPPNAIITARITNLYNGVVLAPVFPINDLHTWLPAATANDGQETFTLPDVAAKESLNLYQQFGKTFQIVLTASSANQYGMNWPTGLIVTGGATGNIKIVPDGCKTTGGFSATTGKSCLIPQ